MKTAAVRALALAALLAGARAAGPRTDAECQHQQIPKIASVADEHYHGRYFHSYGRDLTIHCSYKATVNLTIQQSGKPLQINEVNKTTIQVRVRNPKIGSYIYTCVDNGTGCEDALTVEVGPAMSVESRVHHTLGINSEFVSIAEDYEVLCSGPDAKALEITDTNLLPLLTHVVSRTIRHRGHQTDREQDKIYRCESASYYDRIETSVWNAISVTVDYNHEGFDFRCALNNYRALECSWAYSSDQSGLYSKLFYTDHTSNAEDMRLLCSNDHLEVTMTQCEVYRKEFGRSIFYSSANISFLLMTCNDFFCHNQTFAMNIDTISKQFSVHNLRVLETNSYGAVLKWIDYCVSCVYKAERRLKEERWRQEDASSVHCNMDGHKMRCKFTLLLPYPDTEYEMRVYTRHKDATHEGSWSDPESILVHTEPREECDAVPQPAGTTSAQSALNEVCALTDHRINVELAVNKIKNTWKRKLAKIKKLQLINSLDDDNARR